MIRAWLQRREDAKIMERLRKEATPIEPDGIIVRGWHLNRKATDREWAAIVRSTGDAITFFSDPDKRSDAAGSPHSQESK